MKNRYKVFLSLTILYALFIFYLSSESSPGDPRAILDIEIFRSIRHYMESSDLKFILYPLGIFYKYPDKAAHMILYAVFGFLLYLTLKNSPYPAFRDHPIIFAIGIGILYGMSDEFHQSFVPGRTESIWDLTADGIGVALAQTVIYIKQKICIRR
jgi:VanZ family protein